MKHNDAAAYERQVSARLTDLPRKMIQYHDLPHLSQLVLHSLCDEQGVQLKKAAYFLDNPEFDMFKGIAGYHEKEQCSSCPWQQPEALKAHQHTGNFNTQVRSIMSKSFASDEARQASAQALARQLGMNCSAVYTVPLRHGNSGILMVEHDTTYHKQVWDEQLPRGLALLGYCPVF